MDAAKVPERARGDGHRRPLRRLRQVALPHRAAGQERRRRRHHRRVAGQVRHRGRLAAARRGRQQRAGAARDRRHLGSARRQPVRPPRASRPRRRSARSRAFEIYGFAMLDIGHDFKQIDPDWFDALRLDQAAVVRRTSSARTTTRSPACGRAASASGRRRRPAAASSRPSSSSSCSAPASTPARPRSGCATPRASSAGSGRARSWSPFMDTDVFPNSLEYWGPTGLAFFRNVQVRWTAIQTDSSNLTLALERPGASGDQGVMPTVSSSTASRPRFPLPDFAAAYKYTGRLGPRPHRRHAPAYQLGRHPRRRVRPLRRRHRLGINLSSILKAGEHDALGCSSPSARASRTT